MLLLGVPEGGSDLFLAIPETRLVVKNHSCFAVAGELARMVTQQRVDTFSWLLGFSASSVALQDHIRVSEHSVSRGDLFLVTEKREFSSTTLETEQSTQRYVFARCVEHSEDTGRISKCQV